MYVRDGGRGQLSSETRYIIHLKLANDSFKCDSACVS